MIVMRRYPHFWRSTGPRRVWQQPPPRGAPPGRLFTRIERLFCTLSRLPREGYERGRNGPAACVHDQITRRGRDGWAAHRGLGVGPGAGDRLSLISTSSGPGMMSPRSVLTVTKHGRRAGFATAVLSGILALSEYQNHSGHCAAHGVRRRADQFRRPRPTPSAGSSGSRCSAACSVMVGWSCCAYTGADPAFARLAPLAEGADLAFLLVQVDVT